MAPEIAFCGIYGPFPYSWDCTQIGPFHNISRCFIADNMRIFFSSAAGGIKIVNLSWIWIMPEAFCRDWEYVWKQAGAQGGIYEYGRGAALEPDLVLLHLPNRRRMNMKRGNLRDTSDGDWREMVVSLRLLSIGYQAIGLSVLPFMMLCTNWIASMYRS